VDLDPLRYQAHSEGGEDETEDITGRWIGREFLRKELVDPFYVTVEINGSQKDLPFQGEYSAARVYRVRP